MKQSARSAIGAQKRCDCTGLPRRAGQCLLTCGCASAATRSKNRASKRFHNEPPWTLKLAFAVVARKNRFHSDRSRSTPTMTDPPLFVCVDPYVGIIHAAGRSSGCLATLRAKGVAWGSVVVHPASRELVAAWAAHGESVRWEMRAGRAELRG